MPALDQMFNARQVQIYNDSGEAIPPRSFCEVTGINSDGILEVDKPSKDHLPCYRLVISGCATIPIDGTSVATPASTPYLWVSTNGTAAENGHDFGTVESQWYGRRDRIGFHVAGATTSTVDEVEYDWTCIVSVPIPKTYELTGDEASSENTLKQIESDGDLVYDEITTGALDD